MLATRRHGWLWLCLHDCLCRCVHEAMPVRLSMWLCDCIDVNMQLCLCSCLSVCPHSCVCLSVSIQLAEEPSLGLGAQQDSSSILVSKHIIHEPTSMWVRQLDTQQHVALST